MRLSVFLDHLMEGARQRGISPEEAFRFAARLGVSRVEVSEAYLRREGEGLPGTLARCGLRVGGVYAEFDFPHDLDARRIAEAVDRACAAGAEDLLAVPGFLRPGDRAEEARERIAEGLGTLCRLGAARGLPISIEDYDLDTALYGTSEQLSWLLERTGGLGCAFDTGNFIYHGEDAMQAWERLSSRVTRAHLKDRLWVPLYGRHGPLTRAGTLYPAPVGSGIIPMRALLPELMGKASTLVIEHFDADDQLYCLAQSVAWLRRSLPEE